MKTHIVSLLKSILSVIVGHLSKIDAVPFASNKPRAQDILEGKNPLMDPKDFSKSFRTIEPVVNPTAGSGELVHRPINTFHFILDTQSRDYSCRNNLVIGPGKSILYEDGIPFKSMGGKLRLLKKPTYVEGTVGYMSNTDAANYSHWLVWMLPLLGIYRRLGVHPDYCYVGRPIMPFHVESLSLAGFSSDRILSHPVVADRLIADFADRKNRDGAVDSEMLTFSRNLHLKGIPAVQPHRKIYLGRQGIRRTVVDEQRFIDYLAKLGFESLRLDGLSVVEQAKIFSTAKYIVGPQGSALVNILFSTPASRVLELHPYKPLPEEPTGAPMFNLNLEIASFVGCYYDYMFGKPIDSQKHLGPQADFEIDFDEFKYKINELLTAA